MQVKRRLAFVCVCAIYALNISACMTVGDKTIANIDAKQVKDQVVDGKTTTAEIRVLFGDTQAKSANDGGEMWYYSVVDHKIINATVKTLAVYFSKSGVVIKHVYSEHAQRELF
jgi:outer membrane protein assembly factor BamE (lipoprotein component of BamABCDE complex)